MKYLRDSINDDRQRLPRKQLQLQEDYICSLPIWKTFVWEQFGKFHDLSMFWNMISSIFMIEGGYLSLKISLNSWNKICMPSTASSHRLGNPAPVRTTSDASQT